MKLNGVDLCPNFPVSNVSWFDINGWYRSGGEAGLSKQISKAEYDKLLNEKKMKYVRVAGFLDALNKSNDGYEYRLPTEEEWRLADHPRESRSMDYLFDDPLKTWMRPYSGRSLENSNHLGLFDMQDGVSEWVERVDPSLSSAFPDLSDFCRTASVQDACNGDTYGKTWSDMGMLLGKNFLSGVRDSQETFIRSRDLRSHKMGFRLVRIPKANLK